jgi:hypothetical protein
VAELGLDVPCLPNPQADYPLPLHRQCSEVMLLLSRRQREKKPRQGVQGPASYQTFVLHLHTLSEGWANDQDGPFPPGFLSLARFLYSCTLVSYVPVSENSGLASRHVELLFPS